MDRSLLAYNRIIVFLLVFVFALVPPLSHLFLTQVNAGSLTANKLQINNSQAGASGVTYSFFFTTSATTDIKQIGIKFCTQAGAWGDTCTAPSGFSPGSPTLASDNIAGTGRTTTDPNSSGERMRIVVTTPATQTAQTMQLTFTGVTNYSTANSTFYARVRTFSDTGTTEIDYGQFAAAVLDTGSLAISATVDPNLSFTIAGVASGGNLNGGTGNINVTSQANTIPFGTLSVGTPKIAAHDVTITTNAQSGFTVTASHSAQAVAGPLAAGTNKIDAFTGTNGTPTTWSAPAGGTANTNTGFFGYTTEDDTLCTGTPDRFTDSGPKWAGSTTTGQEIICSTSGVSSQTTRIGWEIQVNAIQPAGGYSGTAILIATPTY